MTHARMRWVWVAIAVLSLAAIARVTLVPTSGPSNGTFQWCLICGDFGLSDFIANIVLFIPVAVALRFWGQGTHRVMGGLFLLSLAIELSQLHIAGRTSSLGDVASNTLGAALGVGLAWWWSRRRRSLVGALMAAAVVLVGITCGGLILRPRLPADVYYGEWNADGTPYEPYHGRVLGADVGGMPILGGRLPNSRIAREYLQNGDPLRVRAIAGPAPRRLTQLFGIGDGRLLFGVLLIGVQRTDLVFMVTTGAPYLRLHQPDLRWRHALASVVPGDTLDIGASVGRKGYCLRLNGRTRCGLAYPPHELWRLIASLPGRLAGAEMLVSYLFMLLMGLPVGLLAPRNRTGGIILLALLLGVGLVPLVVGLAPITPADLAAVAVGVSAGALVPESAGRT